MRAAENARWILRATNDGISAAIDPAGRIASAMPPFERSATAVSYSYHARLPGIRAASAGYGAVPVYSKAR